MIQNTLSLIPLTSQYWFAVLLTLPFIYFQHKYYKRTKEGLGIYDTIFDRSGDYATVSEEETGHVSHTLTLEGSGGTDLAHLFTEINRYLRKSRGTTEFAVIRDKTERLLAMRYDEATACLAFPTHIGLMGTFAGVLTGILLFVLALGDDGITDAAIERLLGGVMVSMLTSLAGLFLTTRNTSRAGEARKHVEEEKNTFYDFVQTELMPSLDASMTQAISHLHETIDTFEPAFGRVITSFQETFEGCTRAFGTDFEKNVAAVSGAVEAMGKNMGLINENVAVQQKLLAELGTRKFTKGLEAFTAAADHFSEVTAALGVFGELRREMEAATEEAITLQREYNKGLEVPREIAVGINKILDRVTKFETSIENLGEKIKQSQMLGGAVINRVRNQITAIEKKDELATRYMELADGKLEDFYQAQTGVIEKIAAHYREAMEYHATEFETMLTEHTALTRRRQEEFRAALEQSIEPGHVQKAIAAVSRLNAIEDKLTRLGNTCESLAADIKSRSPEGSVPEAAKSILAALADIRAGLAAVETATRQQKVTNEYSLFGGRKR